MKGRWILALLCLMCIACTWTQTVSAPAVPTDAFRTIEPKPVVDQTPTPTPEPDEYVAAPEESWDEIQNMLRKYPSIRMLDLTACGSLTVEHAEELAALSLDEVRFTTDYCGTTVMDTDTVFVPKSMEPGESFPLLNLLPHLEMIDLTALRCTPEQITSLQRAFPEVIIDWRYLLCGIEVGPDTETLNYNNQSLTNSLEDFYRVLPLLRKLKSLEMCGCGIGNGEMDALRTAFPSAGIVWSIQTPHWTVRTDADHFATWRIISTDENGKILEARNISFQTNADLDWLQYCHDLVALDVGHNMLTDCEFVRNMPKLKYLILADNRISDLSPVAELKNLKFLEIFANPIEDLSPLSGLTELLDLNACGCYISDLSPLDDLPIDRLWLTPYAFDDSNKARADFLSKHPDCTVVFIGDKDFTGCGWRYHERYAEYRYALGRAKP